MSFDGSTFLCGLIERGDPAAIAQLHPGAEWVVPGAARFGGGTHRGWDELVRFFELVGRLFPQGLRVEPRREWRSGDAVVVEATLSGRTATGGPYRNDYMFVLEWEGDHVTRITEYADTSLAERLLAGLAARID